MRAFWWRPLGDWRNFGDELTPLLLRRLCGIEVEWVPAAYASIVVAGSIGTMLPRRFTGTVLGIGLARPVSIDLAFARVLALRGRLTRDLAKHVDIHEPIALGDPGLLADTIVPPPPLEHPLGIVPHWQDASLRKRYPKAHLIDVRRPPLEVIAAIGSCARIISSSLHGIVVADSYGIPRRWEPHARTQGDGFKFRDHATVVGPFEPGQWATADHAAVHDAKAQLLDAFGTLLLSVQ
jgi:pyruvyltransferase